MWIHPPFGRFFCSKLDYPNSTRLLRLSQVFSAQSLPSNACIDAIVSAGTKPAMYRTDHPAVARQRLRLTAASGKNMFEMTGDRKQTAKWIFAHAVAPENESEFAG
jgi:hypothetical protein